MNKRISMLFTIAAVAVMGATLFGSTYTQTQIAGQSLDISKMDVDVIEQIHQMGGLQLVMPQAFAETDCGALADTGRNVVEFNLTGESVELPIMGGKTYNAMTFSGQVPGPTLKVMALYVFPPIIGSSTLSPVRLNSTTLRPVSASAPQSVSANA